METKKCNRCGEEKELGAFGKNKRMKDGQQPTCFECRHKIARAEYISGGKEREKTRKQKKRQENPEEFKRKLDEYNSKRINRRRQLSRETYYRNRVENIRKGLEYSKKRYHKDPVYRLSRCIRSSIQEAFTKRKYSKKTRTYSILGLSIQEFINHLYSTFLANYNRPYDPTVDIVHIDHVIPISSATTEEEVIKLNHYTNLQLLLAEDNIKKSNKMPAPE